LYYNILFSPLSDIVFPCGFFTIFCSNTATPIGKADVVGIAHDTDSGAGVVIFDILFVILLNISSSKMLICLYGKIALNIAIAINHNK